MGKTFRILDLQKDHLLEAGFTNVREQRCKMPLGPWAKDANLKKVGGWHLLECHYRIEGWAVALLTRFLGVSTSSLAMICANVSKWTSGEAQMFLVKAREGFRDRNIHAYTTESVSRPICVS